MSTFKCKMCGGTLEIQSGSTVAECEYCGAKQTLPKLDDEKRANLYDRANHFRRSNEFDKASAIYEQILAEDNTDAEAYWSLVLCRYGIEYVEDPLSHRRVPTVHRAQFTSIFDDDNYKSALKNSDTYQRVIYEEEAKAINEIQKGILAISQKEEPFDVFICYKETDDSGKRTHDSVLAQDLYYQLKQEGFKVFFSRITLEDKLGSAYEPYIFAALNSAKVMVVLGTKPEYFNAVWVKNEWSRFLSLIKKGEKKMLIPAYKDMDPYNLPKEFSHLQAQDMSKLGFMQDLIRGIKKILGRDKKPAAPTVERVVVQGDSHAQDAAPLLRRAFLFLEDGEFDNADEYAEKVLDINPECAEAYVVKLLIELRLKKPSDLAQCKNPISDSHNYQKALRFATPEYRETIEGYNNAIIKRIDTARKDEVYARGVELMRLHRYDEAVQYFQKIPTYKDSTQKIDDCKKLKETERRDGIYERATQLLNAGQFDEAARLFESIEDHKDSKEKIKLCGERKETARKDAIYSQAMNRVRPQNSDDAAIKKSIEELQTISGYRDVDDQIRALNARLEKWYEDKKKAEEAARIKAEEDRRTREREEELRRIKAEKTKKTVKKVAKIGIPSVVALATLLILLFTLVIPLIRYNKADELFNAGKYDEAMEIYQDIGGFSDSEQRITVLTGIEKIDDAAFEEGIEKILSAGVPVKLTYGMGGGDFSGTTYLSAPQEENNNGIVLLSASTTPNITPLATTTASVPETTEFTYNSSADFSGIQTPGRSGYRFVKWELETYNYQIGGTFEMKLNAVWSEKEYTIEYDLNDGKVTTNNPVEYGIEDDSFTLINPTKTGYTFIGWTGTGLDGLTMSVTIEKGSVGDRSYEANWQANTYTLTFDANGGTVDPTSVTVTYDQDYTVPTPTRAGYTFHGWKFNGVEYDGGKWNVTSDITVVADWVSYTLTTNTNNANAGTFTEKNNVKTTEGDSITLTATTNAGYTFDGWFEGTTKVSSNLTYTFKMPGKNVTLTAKWTANTYTVTYDDTQATRNNVVVTFNYNYSGSTPTTVTLTNGQKLNYPTNPTRSGYVFAGWYTNSSCTTAYNFSGTITADMTLYASWKTCTITNNSTYSWSSSGGVLTSTNKGNSSSSTYRITATMPVTINFSYKTSSESGYDYLYIKKNGSQLKSCSGSTSYVSYSVTLNTGDYLEFIYSKDSSSSDGSDCAYIKDLTYTSNVSYTSTATASCSTVTGYEYANGETASTTVTFGSSHTLPALTRTGYSFLGWYNGTTKVESGNWSIASNVTLTPKWQAGGNTITLDANGGSVTPNSIPVSYDQAYTLPTPTWTGHTFAGWYNGSTQYSSGTWTGLSDITLTARWTTNDYSITFDDVAEINSTATITYNYNYSESTSSTVTLTNGQTLSRPTNPTRSGYVFTGWYTNSSCTTRYEFTDTITGDMTLYAGWQDKSMSYVYMEVQIDPTDYTSSSDYYSVSTSSTSSSYKKHIYLVAEETGTHYIYWKNTNSYSYYGYYLQIYNLTTGTTIRSSSNTYSTSYQSSSFTCSKGDVIVISLYRYNTSYSSYAYFYFSGFSSPAASTATASLPAAGIEYKNNSTYIDSVDYGANYTLPVPTRTGYTFGGWYNGSTKVENGAWNIASNVTLTAKWTANTYTVNFNANGGSVSPTSKTATYDSSFTLPTPTWAGHTFSGWYNGSTKVTSGTWTIASNVTLTARWDSVDYTISYTLNGGTNASSNPSTYTVNDSFTLAAPTKAGYTFLGWTYSGQTTPVKTVTVAEGTMGNLSYTANWKVNDYTVTFDANGGSVTPTSKTVTYDASYTVPTPTRTGYTFAGWYAGSTKYTGGTWKTASNTTLTAKWTARTDIPYVVNHYQQNANDDGYTLKDVQNLTGTADSTIKPGTKSYTHFKSPYVQSVTVKPDGSLVVNYYYDRVTYDLTYVTNGGDAIATETYKYAQTLVIATPVREGFTFGGWFTDKSLGTPYAATATLNADTTIYAYWSEENKPTDFTYTGTTAYSITGYTGTSTTAWIPTYIGGVPVTTVSVSTFKNKTDLVKIVVPDTVTKLETAMFEGCTNLTELVVPFVNNSATDTDYFSKLFKNANDNYYVPSSLTKVTITNQTIIPNYAFYNCKYIEEINIPTSTTSIGTYAFDGCSALLRLNSTVDGVFNVPESVTEIKSCAFTNCLLAETINLGDDVTAIRTYAFSGCKSLTAFIIPTTVEIIESYAFNGCISIMKINSTVDGELNIPTSVKTIGSYAFKGLAGITKVTIPNNVTSLGTAMFDGCTCIEEVTLPFVNNSATDTDYFSKLFKDANDNSYIPSSLTKVTITNQTIIPNYAFHNCKYIEEINIPTSTTSIGSYAFNGCSALLRLNSTVDGVFNVPESVTEIKSYTFVNCLLAETINLGDDVTAIRTHAFEGCKSLTAFTIPATVEIIESYAFNGCISIMKINSTVDGELNIPTSVKTIGAYAFKGLAGITKVTIPNNVTSLGDAVFQNCTCIEEMTLPFMNNGKTDTSYFNILFYTSNNDNSNVPSSLNKVTITNQTVIPDYAFYNCKYIEEINIPTNTTSIGSHAFYGCSALLRLNSTVDGVFNIPENITEVKTYTFYNCSLAEVVNVGESIINIKDYAFAKCASIKKFNSSTEGEFILPESVRVISPHAFEGLTSITKVVIPDSVSAINNDAFKGCNSIAEITLPFIGQKKGLSTGTSAVFGYIFGYNTGSIYNHPSKNYDIPNSIKVVTITAQTVIPEYAFRNCSFIETIILPSTVTSVGTNSFYGCTASVSYTYSATTSIWNGTDISTSFIGSGTEADPYQINNAADLAYLANSVNAGESYEGKYFILNTNINLNTKSWTPIGTKNKAFAGIFDGNNKKIYNLSVTMDTAYAGLFGYVSGTIKNLGIESGTLAPVSKSATTYVGPLVAYLTGTVENCYSKAAVTTNITNIVYAGGLIGHIDSTGVAKNCYASGHISAISTSGFAYAGGFVGSNAGTIEGAVAFGNVKAQGSNEVYSRNGGFVATNEGTLTECYKDETQILTKYTTIGNVYCEDGIGASSSDIINYCKDNWSSSIWDFNGSTPKFK